MYLLENANALNIFVSLVKFSIILITTFYAMYVWAVLE